MLDVCFAGLPSRRLSVWFIFSYSFFAYAAIIMCANVSTRVVSKWQTDGKTDELMALKPNVASTSRALQAGWAFRVCLHEWHGAMHTIRKTSTIYTRVIGVCTKKLLCDRITTPIRWNSNEQWQWAEPSRAAGGWRLESLNREIMAETKSRSRCMDMEYMVMDIDDVNALNTCMSPSPSPPLPIYFPSATK